MPISLVLTGIVLLSTLAILGVGVFVSVSLDMIIEFRQARTAKRLRFRRTVHTACTRLPL